jgi:hypothetical protein
VAHSVLLLCFIIVGEIIIIHLCGACKDDIISDEHLINACVL